MRDERQPDEAPEPIEDLDVPEDAQHDVKGGIKDGTSNTLGARAAGGKHIPDVIITS